MAHRHDLEVKLWQSLQHENLAHRKIVVGFSGGADSLALLWALQRVKKQDVVACYVHHGGSEEASVQDYRQGAANFCEQFCHKHQIPFEIRQRKTSTPGGPPSEDQISPLRSEEELRDFRYETLLEVMNASGAEVIALAHHQDDLLETRLLRLIRGTGEQGLLAMNGRQENLYRPFLKTSKQFLLTYLKHCSISPFEDPSNQNTEPFRNWVRQEWLRALEARQPGGTQSLARSLELLAEAASERGRLQNAEVEKLLQSPEGLSRLAFLALNKEMKKQSLARWMLLQNKRDFSHAHIEEVIKRLDNSQNELTFRVGGIDWYVNAQQITIRS